jgi:serine/threonine protein kinase
MQIVQRQDFSAYKTVGQTDSGKSGTIFKLQDPNNPSQFIAKKEFKNPGDFNSELSILQSVPENDFLVKPLGYDNDSIYYEFHEKGDLFSYINSNRLSPKEIRSIFRKIVAGVQFLHSHSIVHRDLKLENILMDSNCEPKLCDFGFSQKIPDYPIQLRLLGTASYIAPEVY